MVLGAIIDAVAGYHISNNTRYRNMQPPLEHKFGALALLGLSLLPYD